MHRGALGFNVFRPHGRHTARRHPGAGPLRAALGVPTAMWVDAPVPGLGLGLVPHPGAEPGDRDPHHGDDRAEDRPRGGVAHRATADDAEALQGEEHSERRDDHTETQDDYAHGTTLVAPDAMPN